MSPKLAPMLLLATIHLSACSNPTASPGLDGDYTLIGTNENTTLPGTVLFFPASYGKPNFTYDTLGFVTHGSLHIDRSHFTTSLQFQRGPTPTGPVETATSSGNFSLALQTYTHQGILGVGTETFTVLVFRDLTGDPLGHALGSWGTLDRDGQLLGDGSKIIVYYGNGTELLFARN